MDAGTGAPIGASVTALVLVYVGYVFCAVAEAIKPAMESNDLIFILLMLLCSDCLAIRN